MSKEFKPSKIQAFKLTGKGINMLYQAKAKRRYKV